MHIIKVSPSLSFLSLLLFCVSVSLPLILSQSIPRPISPYYPPLTSNVAFHNTRILVSRNTTHTITTYSWIIPYLWQVNLFQDIDTKGQEPIRQYGIYNVTGAAFATNGTPYAVASFDVYVNGTCSMTGIGSGIIYTDRNNSAEIYYGTDMCGIDNNIPCHGWTYNSTSLDENGNILPNQPKQWYTAYFTIVNDTYIEFRNGFYADDGVRIINQRNIYTPLNINTAPVEVLSLPTTCPQPVDINIPNTIATTDQTSSTAGTSNNTAGTGTGTGTGSSTAHSNVASTTFSTSLISFLILIMSFASMMMLM